MSGNLPAGAAAQCSVCFPAWKVAPKDYASLLTASGSMSRVESYWTKLLEPAMQIEVPDEFLSNIIRASQVHCMLAARCEERGSRIAAWTAASVYGPLESESNSIIRGMDMNGQTDFARRSLDFFLKLCNKQGFITTGYTIVGTGEVLWTLGEHYDRTRDRVWMKKIAPEVVRICQWVIRQREKTKRLDARGRKVPEYGLMPPGVTADWDRFAYRLFNDAQYLCGIGSGRPSACRHRRSRRAGDSGGCQAVSRRHPAGVPLGSGPNARRPAGQRHLGAGRSVAFSIAPAASRISCPPKTPTGRGATASRPAPIIWPPPACSIRPRKDMNWIVDYLEDVQFLRSGWGDYPEENNRKDVFCFGGFCEAPALLHAASPSFTQCATT